jgi:hypothetical protein
MGRRILNVRVKRGGCTVMKLILDFVSVKLSESCLISQDYISSTLCQSRSYTKTILSNEFYLIQFKKIFP